jgi:DNA-binding LytR/AlgR family response regulator
MTVLIIEDELLAAERLSMLIKNYDANIQIIGVLETIEESVFWLNTRTHPDLMFVDIHLADGQSFEIFKKVNVKCPIIFTTAYDQYALDAFQLFSIDYILKPITDNALAKAINKFKELGKAFLPSDFNMVLTQSSNSFTAKYKARFLGKIGPKLFFINLSEIAYFEAEGKIVYLINTEGKKFIVNATIEKLETITDPSIFFRANRKHLIHLEAIEQVKPYDNNRLLVIIKNNICKDEIIISREKTTDFKLWADA